MSPFLQINIDTIKANTAEIVARCDRHGISVLGVTKGFSAIEPIVRAMLNGGVSGLADSRMENIIEMRDKGVHVPTTLLRIPRLSQIQTVIQYVDTSINSELAVMAALAEAALHRGRIHQMILMLDLGDLREGVLEENAVRVARKVIKMPGAKLVGLATNMGCFGGVLPSIENLSLLVKLTRRIEEKLDRKLDVVSGGGTSSLLLVESGQMPSGVNQLRIGEGILLGTDTTNQRAIPGVAEDAFVLRAEVIELKDKPSLPFGEIGRDAFGNIPQFADLGNRKRAIIELGRQDVTIEGILPMMEGISIVGASSDHLILDVTDSVEPLQVGDELSFGLQYAGLLSACQSRYIKKVFVGGPYD